MQTQILLNKTRYRDAIDLMSHMILTDPKPIVLLLTHYNIHFKGRPDKGILVDEVTRLLAKDDPQFNTAFSKLLARHIKKKGKDITAIEQLRYKLANEDDAFFGGLIGGVAKGLIGGIGKLFKKKKRRRAPSPVASIRRTSSSSSSQMQLTRLRRDMQRQIAKQAAETARIRRKAEEDKKRAEEKLEKERKENKAKQQQTIVYASIIGGVLLLGTIGFVAMKKPQPTYRMPVIQPGMVPA